VRYMSPSYIKYSRDFIHQLIFLGMESLKMQYTDIMTMPYGMLLYLIEEKNKLQDEIRKQIDKTKNEKKKSKTLPVKYFT